MRTTATGWRKQTRSSRTFFITRIYRELCGWLSGSLRFSARTAAEFAGRTWSSPDPRTNATGAPEAAVAFSPDGKLLAAAPEDGSIRLWDVSAQREIGKLVNNGYTAGLTFSPNGRILAAVDGDKNSTIRLWNVASLRPTGVPITGDAIAFSPAGDIVATVSSAHVIMLLNLASGHQVGRPMPGQAVAFSPDGRFMATADNSGKVGLRS